MNQSLIKQHESFQRLLNFLIFTVLFLFTGLVMADALIRVAADVDKSVITIGDRILYSLIIQHDKNIHIEQPGPGANLGRFEIKDYEVYDPVEENGFVSQKFEYTISVFDTGMFVIPPFPVAFASSDTAKDYRIIRSEPIEIYVKSVLKADSAEIRDIKPPESVPFNYRKWIIIGAGALLLILITLAGIYIIHKRKKGEPLFRKEVIRPAHEIAFEELEKLESNIPELLERGEFKLLFEKISAILRRYIENRYFIEAMEETTSEIRESLMETEVDDQTNQLAVQVLEYSDLVKFAKHIPTADDTEQQVETLREYVNKTKLIFEPVEHKVQVTEDAAEQTEAVVESPETKNSV